MEIREIVLALLVLPLPDITEAVVDFFKLKETPLRALGKRPRLESDDPDAFRQDMMLLKMEQLETVILCSIAHERERERGS